MGRAIAVNDLVQCGPGQTRFTITDQRGGWFKLAYPNDQGVIWRKADALTLVQAAPRVMEPPVRYIHAHTQQLRAGDVLDYGNEHLTIRHVIGPRCYRVCNAADWRLQIYVTDTRGIWRQIGLTTALSYRLIGGPQWSAVRAGTRHAQNCVGKLMLRDVA